MPQIDDRVVAMSFESTKFVSGVSTTLSSLDKLNAALKNAGANNGLDNIEKSANKITFGGLGSAIDKIKAKFGHGIPEADQAFSDVEKSSGKVGFLGIGTAIDKLRSHFSHIPEGAVEAFSGVESASGKVSFSGMTQALDSLGGKFSILQGAASVALGGIAQKAMATGTSMLKSLTLDPVMAGFHNYETQINAVQTIMANTGMVGKKGLGTVQASLDELNTYANKTVYNFSEMAKNIGTFTAAGVDLKTSTAAIKGIANLAALSGSNSQQASTAMYQLSQAIASGKVGLQDWNSVVNAGMGGKVFQKALAQTAQSMGTLKDGSVKLVGPMKKLTIAGSSFRESIQSKPGQKAWLTSEVLTNTLKHFTGDMTDAQLKAEGFSASQIKAIQAQAKAAVGAATNIKTISQLMDALKEEVATSWGAVFKTIFGNIFDATKVFSKVHTAVENFLVGPVYAFNNVLKDWVKLGGKKDVFAGIHNAINALGAVIKPIKEAFREIFPPATGKSLADLSKKFKDLTANLMIGPKTAAGLKSTFKGLFAILDIGKQIIGGIVTAIGHMFGAIGHGSGGVLSLTGGLGDLIVKLDEWLKKGDKIKSVFAGVGDALSVPLRLIGTLSSKLSGMFSGVKAGGATSAMSGVGAALAPAAKAADTATRAWNGFLHVVGRIGDALGPVGKAIQDTFGNFANTVADALKNNNWDSVFSVIQTGLVAGIFLTIKKAIGGGLNIDIGGGVLKNLSGSLDVLRGSLTAIQKNIQAHTLLLIATAIGVLAASVLVLSMVNPAKLASSMSAITVAMAELMAAMAVMNKMSGTAGVLKAPIIAAAMILLAGAIDILAIAVIALSKLSWGELAKGLAGVAGLLVAVSLATIPLSKAGPGMILAGAGLIAIGVAMNILAVSMKVFATMSWADLGKGLAAVAASLVAIGLAMQLMPLTLPITGAGLILVGIGLTALSGAIRLFGAMDLGTLAKGIGAVAVSLVVIAGAMMLMPPTLPLTAASLILVGIGLASVAGAIGLMGNFNLGTLVKGIVGLGAALGVLAVGLTLMIASLPGAAALLIAAGALAILVPTLGLLGSMSWGTIIKGLAAMAISLGVISAISILAAPALIALGVGLGALGIGLTLVATAVYILAKGISLLATNGAKGLGVFMAAFTGIVLLLPKFLTSFFMGLVGMVTEIAKVAPLVAAAMGRVIIALLDVVITAAPKLALAATALIVAFVSVLAKNAGPLIAAGWKLITQLLSGVANNIGQVTRSVADIVSRFLGALSSKAGQLVSAGANALAKFLSGIANNLSRVVTAAGQIVVRYIAAIASNLSKVVSAGAGLVIKLVSGIANSAGKIASAAASAVIKFASGIANNLSHVVSAGVTLVIKLINAVASQSLRMADEGAKAVIRFMHGVADTIRKREPELIAAGTDIGKAIVQGMIAGLGDMVGSLKNKITGIVGSLPGWAKKHLGIRSPSTVFHEIGTNVVLGFANGIDDSGYKAHAAATKVAKTAVMGFKEMLRADSTSGVLDDIGQFVGEGFADGLKGSNDDIAKSFDDLNKKVVDAQKTASKTIQEEHAKINELHRAKHPDKGELHAAEKELKANQELWAVAKQTHTDLTQAISNQSSELGKQYARLQDVASKYQDVVTKLDAAKSALDTIKQTQTDAIKGFSEQYSTLPGIQMTDEAGKPLSDQLGPYTQAVANQITAVSAYKDTLDQLRSLGLDDATYQKLLSDGTADQAFATQLLNGGATAIKGLNDLDAQLAYVSNGLANNAGHNLYDAGVKAAQGLVDGLASQKTTLENTMASLASAMVKAIKKKLHIKSPSREFMKVGRFSTEGIVVGLRASSKAVTDAAAGIGDDALSAMRDSMSRMSDTINAEINSDPTITPILDLSQVQKDAKQLDKMTNVVPITAAASYGMATSVAMAQKNLDDIQNGGLGTIQFVQNNNSPKALSETEIYRQTNNQLSQAKAALGLSPA